MQFKTLPKLRSGDKVAVLSPSFAAPGRWPHVHELGLLRLREIFQLQPVEFPTTRKLGASAEERSRDLIAAFEASEIKAVITSIGGDDQVTYVKHLPVKPFTENPKPFFGYSDNSHFINHLWLNGVPSYYGGALFTEFAMQGAMDDLTLKFLKRALFERGTFELEASPIFTHYDLEWSKPETLHERRPYQPNEGWIWDGTEDGAGFGWGGCVESVDEMLRHSVQIPSLEQFAQCILFLETSEEIPPHHYVMRVLRALGERGILERVRGVLVGRPKAWTFENPLSDIEAASYRSGQRTEILRIIRKYNAAIPVVQNLDFGHSAPQICLPSGGKIEILSGKKTIKADF